MSRRRGATLATSLSVGLVVLLLVAFGTAIALSMSVGHRFAVRATRERIAAASSVQAASQLQRFQQLGLIAEILASRPDFKDTLYGAIPVRDRQTILALLDARRTELGYDLALVTDADGVVVARTDRPDVAGLDLSEQALIRRVRSQFGASGIWAESGHFYEAVAVPLARDQGIFGFLVLGYAVTDVRALEAERGTGSETLFAAADGSVVASSMTPAETGRVLAELRSAGDPVRRLAAGSGESAQVELRINGQRWLARLWPLRDATRGAVGVTVALASLDRELEGYARLRNLLLAIGAVAMLLAWWFALWSARRVTRPVGAMRRALDGLRSGRFELDLPRGGSGEMASLATGLRSLAAEMRGRREMATLVERATRSVGEPVAGTAEPGAQVPPASTLSAAFLALELRRYLRAREAQDERALLERFSKDLQRIETVARTCGGRLHGVTGHRVVAVFPGEAPIRSERALAAAAELAAQLAMPENAFDDVEPPAIAITSGKLVAGSVHWGEAGAAALVGLPLQLAESLLREAGEGDILLSQSVRKELDAGLARAHVEIRAQRGVLATQPLFLISAVEAARVAATADLAVTHVGGVESEDVPLRVSLTGIGPGALLGGRFEIESVLGAGATGIVYRARDRELGSVVALKLLRREIAADRERVERLRAEVAAVQTLAHPHLVRTYELGERDGFTYIASEYGRGVTLRTLLGAGRLPYETALRTARQLLAGLAGAHAHDVLHRDLRAENVLLDASGDVKLMDLGHTPEGATDRAAALSPEQIGGHGASKRSDVYACGCVLFELFTGRQPFAGETPEQLAAQHARAAPPAPSQLSSEVPPALDELLVRTLAKDPMTRPADAAALLAELERLPE